MILFVSYDLKSSRDYTPFYENLKLQGTTWWHYLASTWLISTSKTPAEVAEAVHPYMDTQDFLLVAEMGKYQGYLPKPAWDWIQQQQALPPSLLTASLSSLSQPGSGITTLSDLMKGKIPPPPEPNSLLLKTILGGPSTTEGKK